MNTKKVIQHFLTLVGKDKTLLYCDPKGHPFVRLPLDPKKRPCPLRSQSVRSWISTECFHELNYVPSSRDIEAVLNVLEGHAWKNMKDGSSESELTITQERADLIEKLKMRKDS